ncbi:MAG: hypothetical protein V1748_03260 [Actinomycetota bacterium]
MGGETDRCDAAGEAEITGRLLESIRAYEKSGRPFRFKVSGICVWPLFRTVFSWRYLSQMRGESLAMPPHRAGKGAELISLLTGMPRQVSDLLAGRRYPCGCIFGKTVSTARMGDPRGLDAFFDYTTDEMPGLILGQSVSQPRTGSYPVVIDEYTGAWRAAAAPLVRSRAGELERALAADLADWFDGSDLERDYGPAPPPRERGIMARYMADFHYYRGLLRIIRPRLVVLVCSYSLEMVPLIAAARTLGIQAWELQHGVINRLHFGYSYGEEALAHAPCLPLPDRILTFGPYFTEELASCGYWRPGRLVELGFGRLDHYRRATGTRGGPARPGEIAIMFSTQWTIEDEYLRFIRGFIETMPAGVRAVINPHPRFHARDLSRYRSMAGERVEVMDPGDSLYSRAGDIDIHCSAYSTTLFESAGLGIPTVVLGLGGWSNVKALLDEGAASLAGTPEELAGLARRCLEDPLFHAEWAGRTLDNGGRFFKRYDAADAARVFEEAATIPEGASGRVLV